MVNPRQLEFADDTSPPSPSPPRRKSSRKHASKPSPSPEPVAEQVTKNKKKNKDKNKGLASPVASRIWNEEDELTVLKGLVDYQAKKGVQPNSDWDDFYRFLGGSVVAKFSKEQLLSKIRKLKGKFLVRMQRISQGDDQIFAGTSEAEAFRLSRRIWGQHDSESANQSNTGEETCKQDEEIANHEPLHENVVAKSDFEGKGADESCALRDAFETMMSRGLSDYQKKWQFEKLMNLGSGKKKEICDEWRALCADEVKLNIKRFRFSAMLAEATHDG